jgi:uncharacterized OB-fold protein
VGDILFKKGIFEISKHDSKPYLIGSKCSKCGVYLFPSKKICPACFDDAMPEVSLSRRGKVYSYTIIRQAASGFHVPYATVYVDLPEGVRVFAQCDLSCWEKGEPKIGQEVELVLGSVRTDEQGNQVIGIKFNPV